MKIKMKIIFPAACTSEKYPALPAVGGHTSPQTGGGESKGGACSLFENDEGVKKNGF